VIAVLDATVIDEPQNADEALAYFLCYAHEDDTIQLHTAWCRTQLDARHECTCTPTTMRLGARA
jgi:hypothetical protein